VSIVRRVWRAMRTTREINERHPYRCALGDAEQGAPRRRGVIVTFSMTSTAGGCEALGPGAPLVGGWY
jgi:hypothetical protein